MRGAAEVELPIGGMSCASCARTVEKQLSGTEGVESASVNFATHVASVRYNEAVTSVGNLVSAVEAVGYEVPFEPEEQNQAVRLRKRLIAGAAFAIPVFILGMLGRAKWVQFALTLPVLFYAGQGFFRDAWIGLRHRSANMNTLIALGTGTAFVYSIFATEVYFEAAAVIIVLVLLGRMLEARATGKTSEAIRRLISLQP
jgi:cation transport ATPase